MKADLPQQFCHGALLIVVLSLSSVAAADDQESSHHKQVMDALRRGLPKYEAKDPAPSPTPQKNASSTPSDTPFPSETQTAAGGPPSSQNEKSEGAIPLPKMVINSLPIYKGPLANPLPRIPVKAPVKDVQVDDFTSPAERDRRLVEKHLSAFDRTFLNRYNIFGVSKESRAREAERLEQSAIQLNHIADIIEVDQQFGIETEEDRKLRKEYIKLLRTRPR